MSRYPRFAGHAALWVFIAAAAAFGAMPAAEAIDFAHHTHPLAFLGAVGMPGAAVFNGTAFVLAGTLAAVALWPLRDALPPPLPWTARIGAQLVLLSAVAFAAQGLMPIDPENLDGLASGLHGSAWTLWWLAFAAGNASIAWGMRKRRGAAWFIIATLAAQIVPLCALLAEHAMPVAVAQRLSFLLWFAWVAWVAWVSGRSAGMRPEHTPRHAR